MAKILLMTWIYLKTPSNFEDLFPSYTFALQIFLFHEARVGIFINRAWPKVMNTGGSGVALIIYLFSILMKNVLNNIEIWHHDSSSWFLYLLKFDHLSDINTIVYLWKGRGYMPSEQAIYLFITKPASQRHSSLKFCFLSHSLILLCIP